jgi:hypothetical protein
LVSHFNRRFDDLLLTAGCKQLGRAKSLVIRRVWMAFTARHSGEPRTAAGIF